MEYSKFHAERILTISFITVSPTSAILTHIEQVPIYMCVCVCVYVYIYAYICIYMYVCIYIYIYETVWKKDKPHRWWWQRGLTEKEFPEEAMFGVNAEIVLQNKDHVEYY